MTRLSLALLVLPWTPGCGPTNCDTMAVASVQVTVSDAAGTPLDAEVRYARADEEPVDCESMGDDVFVCGWEVAGEITLYADAWGYAPLEYTLTVDEDACHVIPESVDLVLEPVVCTEEALPSVLVTVTDGQGADVTSGDVVWNLADEDDLPEPCSHLGGNQWACGEEVAGDLRIDIDNAGPYEPWTQVVTVDEDECHVITEEVDAVLAYLPD